MAGAAYRSCQKVWVNREHVMTASTHGFRITPFLLLGLITFGGIGGAVLGVITRPTAPSSASQAALTASSVSQDRPANSSSGADVANANSDCSPATEAASSGGSPATLESSDTRVASGTVEGQSWSLWSANGQSGADGLENGGLVLGGNEYGLCPGYPNPAELEMIDTGSNAIVVGVVGYSGLATVALSESTVGTFDVGQTLPAPQVQVVNGVSFFIGALPSSACDYSALELNTTSPGVSAEHNLGFDGCVTNQLVPITASQGTWQLPAGQFPSSFGGSSPGSASTALVPNADSICSPTTDAATSGGSPATLESSATQVASGTVNGQSWSLWSANGQTGATALEDGGLVLDGNEYGLCPGYPNPAELEMIDTGSDAVVYGVVGYPGLAKVDLSQSTIDTFDVGQALPSPQVQVVNGVSFFIGALPDSACSYTSLELNTTSPGVSAEHNLGFAGAGTGEGFDLSDNPGNSGGCVTNEIDPISFSQGIWQLPPGQFTNGFGGGIPSSGPSSGPVPLSPGDGGLVNVEDSCAATTTTSQSGMPAGPPTSSSTEVASGTVTGHSWSLWAAHDETGVSAIEQGGFVLDGRWYSMCPGAPNPAEFAMIDSSPTGIVYGYVANPGAYSIALNSSGQALPAATTKQVNGGTFFVDLLTKSACAYASLDLDASNSSISDMHHFDFGSCSANQLVQTTSGYGSW
jgi:hypothetical protein